MNPFSQLIGLALVIHVLIILYAKSVEISKKMRLWFASTKALPSFMIIGVISSLVLMMTMATLLESLTDTHSNIRMAGDFAEAVVTTHEMPTSAYASGHLGTDLRADSSNSVLAKTLKVIMDAHMAILIIAGFCVGFQIMYLSQKSSFRQDN